MLDLQILGVIVGVGVAVKVGVGVGVSLHGNNNISSHPEESVTITKTSPYNGEPSKTGTSRVNVGGTDTTPVITVSQYVLVISQMVIS